MKVVTGEYLRIREGSCERVYIYDDNSESIITITQPFFDKLKKKGVKVKEENGKEIKQSETINDDKINGDDKINKIKVAGYKSTPQKSLSTFFEEKEEKTKPVGIIIDRRISDQKSLLPFFGEKDKEEIVAQKFEKKKSGQIETDYYEQSRIEICANQLRERFNVTIEILPVRYGRSDKIYGYYMLITTKAGIEEDREKVVDFIKECNIKVY